MKIQLWAICIECKNVWRNIRHLHTNNYPMIFEVWDHHHPMPQGKPSIERSSRLLFIVAYWSHKHGGRPHEQHSQCPVERPWQSTSTPPMTSLYSCRHCSSASCLGLRRATIGGVITGIVVVVENSSRSRSMQLI